MSKQKKFDGFLAKTVDVIVSKINEIYKKQKILICLTGQVGCGKTRLVKLICQKFKITNITSPTYLFYQQYNNPGNLIHILHIDFYRNQSLYAKWAMLLFEEIDIANIIFVEWNNKHLSDIKKYFNFYQINVNFESSLVNKYLIKLKFPKSV